MQIKFTTSINNASLQVGDSAYYVPSSSLTTVNNEQTHSNLMPTYLGVISGIGLDYITLDDTTLGSGSDDLSSDDFIMFSKNKTVNNASMLGYYAEVQLRNSSTKRAELFSLSSEVVPSSK